MSDTVAADRSLLLAGDCVERMRELPEASVDAVVCDPPYGLEFMGKDWDAPWRTGAVIHDPATERGGFQDGRGGNPYSRSRIEYGRGNAGESLALQAWHESWAREAFRVLKPGGHLLAFGGTRTYHRLACAVEDAGFEIRDTLVWIYGSGFPKSLNVSKAIDLRAGAEREVVGSGRNRGAHTADQGKVGYGDYEGEWNVTAPATDEARQWDGWGTALKPAHEPIVMARKPLEGTVAENVLAHGTGALNIDATRIGAKGGTRQTKAKAKPDEQAVTSFGRTLGSAPGGNAHAGGRWPANVTLAHLPECKGETAMHTERLCAPGCPVAELNEQTEHLAAVWDGGPSSGDYDATSYKIGSVERNAGKVKYDGIAGHGARFFYVAKAKRRERIAGVERNLHPTVKPVELMRWLIRLVTPPGGVVLDPFLGSGSTGCAAAAERVRFIGIEREPDYLDTARARIADWLFAHPD